MSEATTQTVGTFGWWEIPGTPEMQDVAVAGWFAENESSGGKPSKSSAAAIRIITRKRRR